jgi:DNA-binding CsgD family transcriptional regulator
MACAVILDDLPERTAVLVSLARASNLEVEVRSERVTAGDYRLCLCRSTRLDLLPAGFMHRTPTLLLLSEADDAVGLMSRGARDFILISSSSWQIELQLRLGWLVHSLDDRARRLVEVSGLRIDRRERQATLEGRRLDLTPTELDLLLCLVERSGTLVRHEDLVARAGIADDSRNNLKTHVARLRAKLGGLGSAISAQRGEGYRFVLAEASPSGPEP